MVDVKVCDFCERAINFGPYLRIETESVGPDIPVLDEDVGPWDVHTYCVRAWAVAYNESHV